MEISYENVDFEIDKEEIDKACVEFMKEDYKARFGEKATKEFENTITLLSEELSIYLYDYLKNDKDFREFLEEELDLRSRYEEYMVNKRFYGEDY